MTVDVKRVEARTMAVKLYRVLAIVEGVLAVILLVLAGIASIYESRLNGIPYYSGGFIVGSFMVIGGITAAILVWRAKKVIMTDVKQAGVGCLITTHYILTIVTLMGCFLAVVLTGMFGLCTVATSCHSQNLEVNKALAIALACLIIAAFFTNVAAMVTVCTYGSYFGVNFKHHGRHHVTIWHSQMLNAGINRIDDAGESDRQTSELKNLQQQNLLLLQQNQQLLQQQLYSEQQQQQPAGSSGAFPPRPPDIAPPQYSVDDPLYPHSTMQARPVDPPPNMGDKY